MQQRDASKLPKWAQQRIETLERNVDYWREKAMDGPADSDTFIRRYIDNGRTKGQPLGKGETIVFVAEQADTYYESRGVEVTRMQDGSISVRTIGGGRLAFLPSASNSGYLLQLGR